VVRDLAVAPILEQLWSGSTDADVVGWRWCEYRINERKSYPSVFYALCGNHLDIMPTAPMFVLRARCKHCCEDGFFVSVNLSREDREERGLPRGRCATCRRTASSDSSRQRRSDLRAGR
jgi:hypothetical protein